jgi:hypothetical protein
MTFLVLVDADVYILNNFRKVDAGVYILNNFRKADYQAEKRCWPLVMIISPFTPITTR